MARITVVTTGFKELDAKLRKLESAEQKKIVRAAARAALRPALTKAKSLAPNRTGNLAKATKIKALTKAGRGRIGARIRVVAINTDGVGAFTGPNFYHAFIAYGWKTGSRAGGHPFGSAGRVSTTRTNRTGKYVRRQIPGNNWLLTAAETQKAAVLNLFRTELGRRIIEAASKATSGVKP